ncbi:hypothetical protein GCM10010121_083700 [Streptomyces brasiliensis]|uniref:Uncharacterized protein n=1 Tax=Streptomyces brasiliensis TaxID=1954 RepID=A0A917P3W7_9ACTN|nr:hypothetical protein GCM10010121_083700 [Streptomyces brasiliensis]
MHGCGCGGRGRGGSARGVGYRGGEGCEQYGGKRRPSGSAEAWEHATPFEDEARISRFVGTGATERAQVDGVTS